MLLKGGKQLIAQRHATHFVHIEAVRLVHKHNIPCLGIQKTLPALPHIRPQGFKRGNNGAFPMPEAGFFCVVFRAIDIEAKVKHAEQTFLPLCNKAGGHKNQCPAHTTCGIQRRKNQTCFDSLSETNIISNEPAHGILVNLTTNPELMRQKSYSRAGKDTPLIVDGTDTCRHHMSKRSQRIIKLAFPALFYSKSQAGELGKQTFFHPARFKAHNGRIFVYHADAAFSKLRMPHSVIFTYFHAYFLIAHKAISKQ